MSSILLRTIRQSLLGSVAFIITVASSNSAETSSWLASLNPLNLLNRTSVSTVEPQNQPVKPQYELYIYILGENGDQLDEADTSTKNLITNQSSKKHAPLLRQNTEEESFGPITKVNVNNPAIASKYLAPFQSNKARTTLFIQNSDQAPVALWEDAISKILYLDHLSTGDFRTSIDEPTLKLLSEKLPATNLTTIDFDRYSLSYSNIETALPYLKELLRKNTSLKKVNLLGLQRWVKDDYPIINNLFQDLPPLPSLTRLELSGLTVDDQGLEMLGAFLSKSPFLTHLSTGGGTSVGLLSLCETLLKLEKLETLELSLGTNDSTEIVLKILLHPNLENLTINGSESSLTADSYKKIGRALSGNIMVTRFKTSLLDTPEKASDFFSGLVGNGNLKSLHLPVYAYKAQGMGDNGGVESKTHARLDAPLSYLDLTGSNIGPKGAQDLVDVLRNRTTCTTFKAGFSSDVVEILMPLVISGKICLNTMIG